MIALRFPRTEPYGGVSAYPSRSAVTFAFLNRNDLDLVGRGQEPTPVDDVSARFTQPRRALGSIGDIAHHRK